MFTDENTDNYDKFLGKLANQSKSIILFFILV